MPGIGYGDSNVTLRNKAVGAKAPTITDWTRALQDAIKRSPGYGNGVTTLELAAMTDWGVGKVRRHLKLLLQEGKIVCGNRLVTSLIGVRVRIPCYSLKSGKAALC